LEALVSPEQRAEGQRLASNWKVGDTFKNIRNIPDTQKNISVQNKETVRWEFVWITDSDAYFIDSQSIQKIDGLIYVWVKNNAKENKNNDYKLNRWVVNCSNHTAALISHISRDSSGKTTSNFDEETSAWKFRSLPPGSIGAKLANTACSTSVNAASTGGSGNSSGSGVVVSASGYLLTNNHVVNGCTSLKIHDSAKLEHAVIVIATDEKSDLALLKTVKPVSLPAATFRADGSVESGESVVVLGYPLAGVLASEVNVSFGYVSATAGLADDTSKLQISAPVQPGNSGGPLLDQSGNLIGVVVSKLDALKVAKAIGDIPQNINFAVKGEIAQVFLKAHKVKFTTAATTKKLENTDLARRGREFTVLVECSR
jgi:S1-C subfamily serine protease